ncbi:MAG: zinc-dependent alcohol dehydrogenase [Sphaerochaetaceae bacterium]
MKAAFLKAPYKFELRDVELRDIHDDEVLVKVKACGFCGHDNILARYAAKDWEPFGHEFSGIVVKKGKNVNHLSIGDKVVAETSTFDPLAECALNGRVDWDPSGPTIMDGKKESLGFAEYIIVPAVLCIKFDGLEFPEASMIEPLGVAYDLVLTGDIHLGDDVLVMGLGAIGLMALKMAKSSGARRIYAAEFSNAVKKCDLARQFGADKIIHTDKIPLEDFKFEKGGVDRVLVTTPPKTIGSAVTVLKEGGKLAFLGIGYGEEAPATFDSNVVHLRKLTIQASNAIPALYFPKCIDLLKSGLVETKSLITNTFDLDNAVNGLSQFINDRANSVKAVMVSKD